MRKFIIVLVLLPIKLSAQEISIEDLMEKQINVESRGKHMITEDSIITSPAGALGIAQFMPDTWEWMKYTNRIPAHYDILNKDHQLHAYKVYMRYLYNVNYGIDDSVTELALASYNAGVNKVKRLIKTHGSQWKEFLPSETKDYLNLLVHD